MTQLCVTFLVISISGDKHSRTRRDKSAESFRSNAQILLHPGLPLSPTLPPPPLPPPYLGSHYFGITTNSSGSPPFGQWPHSGKACELFKWLEEQVCIPPNVDCLPRVIPSCFFLFYFFFFFFSKSNLSFSPRRFEQDTKV